MNASKLSDTYITTELLPRVPPLMTRHRSRAIEDARRERCLTPNGHYLFSDALVCYLAHRREEGDELVAKARAFLQLAHSIGERQRYDYVRGYCEGVRSAELSYLDWFTTGQVNGALLADARANLEAYYSRPRYIHWKTASNLVPILLYTESYLLIRRLVARHPARADGGGSVGPKGVFGHAMRIASAESEAQRRIEKESLRKKIPGRLFTWINTGLFVEAAFALYALFPRPDGLPCELIEGCWGWIPESVIKKWQDSR